MTPLTPEQIFEINTQSYQDLLIKWKNHEGGSHITEFARAIERAHGIGEQHD